MHPKISQRPYPTALAISAAMLAALLTAAAVADGFTILQPTQGRPAFVAPGGTLAIVVDLPDATMPGAALLETASRTRIALTGEINGGVLRIALPAEIPCRTYDLELEHDRQRRLVRRAVAVWRPTERIRIVQLPDLNLGHPATPALDLRLIDEINLIGPTLIICAGDIIDAAHPDAALAWSELRSRLAEFHAPVLLARGDHDDPRLFSRFAAPSALGGLRLGRFLLLTLSDLPTAPLHADAEQLRWLRRELREADADTRIALIGHADPRRDGATPDDMKAALRTDRLTWWYCGSDGAGEIDASPTSAAPPGAGAARSAPVQPSDGDEFSRLEAARIVGAPRAVAKIDAGDARLRYRVIDWDSAAPRAVSHAPELAVGGLAVAIAAPNDGTAARLSFAVTNAHPVALSAARLRLLIARSGDATPWVRGARLTAAHDLGWAWECAVEFDLPAHGAVRAVIGTAPPPPDARLQVSRPKTDTADGVDVGVATNRVCITCDSAEEVEFSPVLMRGTRMIRYRIVGENMPAAAGFQLRLPPGQAVELEPMMEDAAGPAQADPPLELLLRFAEYWERVAIEPQRTSAATASAAQ